MTTALTVDLEEWFQVTHLEGRIPRTSWDAMPARIEPTTERLLELFARHGARATFFALGWIVDRHPALVRRIAAAGHDVESHGGEHRLVHDLDPRSFREDLRRSLGSIGDVTGRRPTAFRAPSFSLDPRCAWAFDVLADEGIELDSSIFPVRHPRYGAPGFPRFPHRIRTATGREILELPLATIRLAGLNLGVAGGAYLRILPLWFVLAALGSVRDRGRPAVLYIHPWEVDPSPPRAPIRGWGRFTHHANLGSTEARLDALLSRFAGRTLREASSSLEREDLPVVDTRGRPLASDRAAPSRRPATEPEGLARS